MPKYARRPTSAGWVEDETFSPEPSRVPDLFVADAVAVKTGLIWSDGTPVMRAPNPIGFGREDEW